MPASQPNKQAAAPIRMLIVDDHPIVRMGLRQVQDIEPLIKVVGDASSGAEALRLAATLKPDVVLLDFRLPDIRGDEVCRKLKEALPNVRVLFLSSFAVDSNTAAAFEAGADGYLLKENDARKIVDAVMTVREGGMVIDPGIARATLAQAKATDDGSRSDSALAQLSDQENRILAELANGAADKEIAYSLKLQPKTVRNYLVQVYRKLDVHSRTQAALLYHRARGTSDEKP